LPNKFLRQSGKSIAYTTTNPLLLALRITPPEVNIAIKFHLTLPYLGTEKTPGLNKLGGYPAAPSSNPTRPPRLNIITDIIIDISKKESLGSCFVAMDIGSSEQPASMQNLQILNIVKTRIILKWLLPPCFSDRYSFTSSRPDAVLVVPISAKTKKQQIASSEGGWILRSGRGQMG
jgi:hypothetical protein